MKVKFKVLLAVSSGIGCWVIYYRALGDMPLYLCGLSGALFAGGVLFPYLRKGQWIPVRAIALAAISTISNWCALQVAEAFDLDGWPLMSNIGAFVSASLVGALIVLIGAKFIIPLRCDGLLAILGAAAAICGGLVFSAVWFLENAARGVHRLFYGMAPFSRGGYSF